MSIDEVGSAAEVGALVTVVVAVCIRNAAEVGALATVGAVVALGMLLR
jgi:hypothetical protein